MQVPEVVLNSGHSLPLIGMGTAADHLPLPEHLTSIIIDAIAAGHCHFDTAALYGTEEPLGRAVVEALKRGLMKNRDEVFITSKLWCTDADYDLVLPALKSSLRKLGLSYVDLYLIHWPVRSKPGINHFRFSKEDIVPFDMKGTWKAMEECCKLGLAKSVGVSNFSCAKIEQLLQHATIPPAVNQVEMNVAWQQKKMLDFCGTKGIHVSAWSPLGANGAYWGSHRVLKSPVLQQIATAKHKTVAQVALRWIYEEGASIIVKSFNNERMKQNLEILDWKLTEEEVKQIKQINQCRGFLGELFLHENGPYKTLDQLWDGEI